MAPRTYGDPCAVARALDLVGERWALLVVRELLLGPKRFTDLRAGIPNAKPSVLSRRLRELEDGGVLGRRKLGAPTSAWAYELTALGYDLEPVVIALGRWGRRLPAQALLPHSVDSLVLALKWRFDPDIASGLSGSSELRLANDHYAIDVAAGAIDIRRGQPVSPSFVIETDPETLDRVVFGGRSLADALRSGEIAVEGDEELAASFLGLYAQREQRAAANGDAVKDR
jgi:DNA-binding HxlR family transcriptional regulator